MIQFFDTVLNFISYLAALVWSNFRELAAIVRMLLDLLPQVNGMFIWAPAGSIGLIVAIITVAIVYKILGR